MRAAEMASARMAFSTAKLITKVKKSNRKNENIILSLGSSDGSRALPGSIWE